MKTGGINWDKAARIFDSEEKELKKNLGVKQLLEYPQTKILLMALAGAGVLTLAVLMPGLAGTLTGAVRAVKKGRYKRRLERLKNQKMVQIKEVNGETLVEITEDGRKQALKYKFDQMTVSKPKNGWDSKWRVVIFDVPDKKRYQRDLFRQKLLDLGFKQLNESVFIHPYPCFNEVEFVRQVYAVGAEVTFLLVDKIEGEKNWEKIFDVGAGKAANFAEKIDYLMDI
ncbi:MAG: hypothetical protein Q7S14_01870 [bacterium]|nr:hypothetical protein [bacterium]